MGEIQKADEATFPAKRKQYASQTSKDDVEEKERKTQRQLDPSTPAINTNNHASPVDNNEHDPEAHKQKGSNFIQDEEEEEEEEEDGDYVEGEDDEEETGAVVDRKGKGVLVEEGPRDDDDDVSSDGSDTGGEEGNGEVEDDPLAEVDLDNILPYRTRSRRPNSHHGIRIANDVDGSNDLRGD